MGTEETIEKYMTTDLTTFKPGQDIYDVVRSLLKNKISGAPVVNDKYELVGVISEKDCLKVIVDCAYHNLPPGRVADYMTSLPQTIPSKTTVAEAAYKFLNSNYRRFPVVDPKGKLIGQLSRRDVLRSIKEIKATTWYAGRTKKFPMNPNIDYHE